MPAQWLLVDGYSLLHQDPGLSTLRRSNYMLARQRLVAQLEDVAGKLAERTTVVFDGQRGGPGEEFAGASIEVVFSPRHQTADTVIERLVCNARSPGEIIVVTSDRGERDTVLAAGAQAMSCAQFLDHCADRRDVMKTEIRSRQALKPTLGDLFPDGG